MHQTGARDKRLPLDEPDPMPHLSTMDEPRSNAAEFTVSEIAFAVKHTVEDAFGYVRVRGEISGFRGRHASGHAYFTLKDDNAGLDAVVWKGNWARLAFKPEEGLEVIATGRLTTFPRSSKYQIVIEALEPAGAGALMALLEERRKKLLAEGLFDPARKKELPYLPRLIGVVTSPTGAVIRDILHRLADRFPTDVIVWPVRVQGETSAAEVAAAVRGFNALVPGGPIPRPDLIIVARGGGSIEDLWGFNEEIVVRAVAESEIPVISAVGHETDTTLIDHVSDLRTPTPSAAAEAAVPVRAELVAYVENEGLRQRQAVRRLAANAHDRVRAAGAGLPKPHDLVAIARQRLDHATSNLLAALRQASQRKTIALGRVAPRLSPSALANMAGRARLRFDPPAGRLRPLFANALAQRHQHLDGLGKLLASLSYKGVLARGFALVTTPEGALVRSAGATQPGAALAIEWADGRLGVTVTGSGSEPPGATGAASTRPHVRPKKTPDDSGQTSLF